MAGEPAGALTEAGADWLGVPRDLAGIPLCPPEGDAGTGMVATNAVTPGTGNVSAGTSIFAMAVLEKPLSRAYPEVGVVATPAGAPVAMVHGSTCTSDLDAWVRLFGELSPLGRPQLYDFLYNKALEAAPDAGGLVNFNCYSGEPVIGLSEGCPLHARAAGSDLTLANFMRAQLFSALAVLRTGMDILSGRENVALNQLVGHGGLFKTKGVGQRLLAGALGVPVAVMATAGEGGPWGMALLAAYMLQGQGQSLDEFLADVFASAQVTVAMPEPEIAAGFAAYLERWQACLPAERAAAEGLRHA
jgi:sugar (pentulose or hexulose) kinase